MANPCSTDFSFPVHGTGIPNADCGSYPNITISFKIVFERSTEDGYQKVYWHTEGMSWNSGDQGNGKFGYPYHIYILVNGDRDHSFAEILEKTQYSSTTNWEAQVHPHDVQGWFLSTLNTTNVAIYAQSSATGGCYHASGTKPCYTGKDNIQGISCVCLYDVGGVPLPEYTQNYTITYDANGGQNPPAPQVLTDPIDLTLTTQTPTYPVSINYHNSVVTTQTAYRPFNHWNTNSSDTGTSYGPGAIYTGGSSCTLHAIWDSASFRITTALDRKWFILNYDANGGTVSRASDSFERNRLGYSSTQGSSTVTHTVGGTYQTTDNLDLWPVYNSSIEVSASTFPTPTRQGYVFLGWYTSGGTQIGSSITLTTDTTTIYAHWGAQPIHKFQNNNTWSNEGPKVWIFNARGDNQWHQDAPIYKFDGTNWINISE